MQGLLDIEEVLKTLMKYNVTHLIFEAVESPMLPEADRAYLGLEIFRYMVVREHLDYAIMIWSQHEIYMHRNMSLCIEGLLTSLDKSPNYLILKLALVDRMLKHMAYEQVERLLHAYEKWTVNDLKTSYFFHSANPILTGVKLLDNLTELSSQFSVAAFRVSVLQDIVMGSCREILLNLYLPAELKLQVRRKDFYGKSALFYMEKMDAFTLMDTKVMDRIMKEYWNSNVDVSGSLFANSTCYQLWNTDALGMHTDYEKSHRFY